MPPKKLKAESVLDKFKNLTKNALSSLLQVPPSEVWQLKRRGDYNRFPLPPATGNIITQSVIGTNLPSIGLSPTSTPSSVSTADTPQLPLAARTVTQSLTAALPATTHRDAWEMAKNGLDATLRLLFNSTDAFPPLKSDIGGTVGLIDLFKNAAANREELKSELDAMVETLKQYGELKPIDPSDSAA
ncbi:hypothetical protein H0H87_006573, partial [Tephrocybe sp. NHM501043]